MHLLLLLLVAIGGGVVRHVEGWILLLLLHGISTSIVGPSILVLLVEAGVVGTLELREVRLVHVGLLSRVVREALWRHVMTWHDLLPHSEVPIERLLRRA